MPFIGGLFWKGATRKGAVSAILVGATMALIDMTGFYRRPERMLFPIAGSLVAFIVASLWSRARLNNS